MGVDRLLAAMEHLGRVRPVKTAAQVLVSVMDETLAGQCMRVAFDLRRAGIRTEIQVAPGKLGKQLKRANRLGIPYVVLIGSNEAERDVVTVKQMAVAMNQGCGDQGPRRVGSRRDSASARWRERRWRRLCAACWTTRRRPAR